MAIAMMFVRLSICLSVCLSGTVFDHTRYTFARISVYSWIVRCPGHSDTKASLPTPSHLFPVPPGTEVGCGCAN